MTLRPVVAYTRAEPDPPRTPYTLDRLQADIAVHHAALAKAIKKYGLRRGELTLGEYRSALNALAPGRAGELGYMNPYARQVWERALRRAVVAYDLHAGPPFMLTVLHQPWHFPLDTVGGGGWHMDLPGIIGQAREALDGLSYLLLVEIAPLTYFIRRYVAPHLQGFLFEDLPRRRRERLATCLGGAKPLVLKQVHDFAGASSYNVKPPDHMETCFARADGALVHRGRKLWLTEHYFLWRHLRSYAYPDLTFAGGAGLDVLRSARRACGLPGAGVIQSRRRRTPLALPALRDGAIEYAGLRAVARGARARHPE